MQALASRALRVKVSASTSTSTSYSSCLYSCRLVAGRRLRRSSRAFNTSATPRNSLDPPSKPVESSSSLEPEHPVPSPASESPQHPRNPAAPSELPTAGRGLPIEDGGQEEKLNSDDGKGPKSGGNGPYGSAVRRASRSQRKRDAVSPKVARWFLQSNVELAEDLTSRAPVLRVKIEDAHNLEPQLLHHEPVRRNIETQAGQHDSATTDSSPTTDVSEGSSTSSPSEAASHVYEVDGAVIQEITALANAGLKSATSSQSAGSTALKPHLVLQSPKKGGAMFLGEVIRQVASTLNADVIQLGPQDFADIAWDHTADVPALSTSLRTLGYDTYLVDNEGDNNTGESADIQEGRLDGGEDDAPVGRSRPNLFPWLKPSKSKNSLRIAAMPIPINDIFKSIKVLHSTTPDTLSGSLPPPVMAVTRASGDASAGQEPRSSEQSRVFPILNAFLGAADMKAAEKSRGPSPSTTATYYLPPSERDSAPVRSNDLIVMVPDYLELSMTQTGSHALNVLHEVVNERRSGGQRVIMIGTSSAEDLMPGLSQDNFRAIQTEGGHTYRTVVVPCISPDAKSTFAEDEKLRTKQINIRNIASMVRWEAPQQYQVEALGLPDTLNFDSSQVFAWGLNDSIWTFEQVNRIAAMALGLLPDGEALERIHLETAINMLETSDKSKFSWIDLQGERSATAARKTESSSERAKRVRDGKFKKLRKGCNKHEKGLLSGVIDSQSIKTTFDDVHVDLSAVEALKTLTSLSLIRPDAFTYGVLARNKIPGLLLYGPPGTGKTLLAKAVAKESGATVLEVSGSDIYDMYVGEGEKNVRAIFTLAKKLAPCVVFIDEADAIFGSRSQASNRTSHRELINQFLREWDGLNEQSAFIMVATNRPFDLDDAVLRRLPRRVLVDLPTEKDREAILRIHLQGETLRSDVDLSVLARQTPLYSGSDLKNVCVAAALACVREENDAMKLTTRRSAASKSTESSDPSNSTTATATTDTVDAPEHASPASIAPSAASTQSPSTTNPSSAHSDIDDSITALSETPARTTSDDSAPVDETKSTTSSSDASPSPSSSSSSSPYPARRTLTNAHFQKALGEISASISEDMSSLAAIRKFDEKYGDRPGRRKKLDGGWGFGTLTKEDRERERIEQGRVRTDELVSTR